MIEATLIWNDPRDARWDGDAAASGRATIAAADAVARADPGLTRVLGGVTAGDAETLARLGDAGALDRFDAVQVRGFPLDWSLWPVDAWPDVIAETAAAAPSHRIWAEAGAGSFGAEEVQVMGLDSTIALLDGRVDRLFWNGLFDLPRGWGVDSRHREAEGSSYYRLFYLGLVREDGSPKAALEHVLRHTPALGIAQAFAQDDARLGDAVGWLQRLGVRRISTTLPYAGSLQPGWQDWADRLMAALAPFETTLTFRLTPDPLALADDRPDTGAFADFCAEAVGRYAVNRAEALVA